MRNLAQYPITTDECISHILYYGQKDLNSGNVGGTGPYVVSLVAEFLRDNLEFEKFIESKKI